MKNQQDSNQEVIPPVQTTPTQDEDDEEAILEAARHRQHAQTIVRDHLENHADNNPGASSDYVTWIATLHPENADITIDQRFFVPGNPWWTIYEDTKNNSEIPLATAVPLSSRGTENGTQTSSQHPVKAEDIEGGRVDDTSKESNMERSEELKDSSQKSDATTTTRLNKSPHFCLTCNPIAMFCGLALAVPALIAVLTLEMVAFFICYLPGTLFYHFGQAFAPPNCCSCLLYSVFMLVYGALSFADSMILVASVFATECLCLAALFVGFVTGGCLWAKYLQQHIRKLCHGIRIVFRKSDSNNNNPPRGLCCGRTAEERERKRDAKAHLKGVRVITVQRVRRPCESYH